MSYPTGRRRPRRVRQHSSRCRRRVGSLRHHRSRLHAFQPPAPVASPEPAVEDREPEPDVVDDVVIDEEVEVAEIEVDDVEVDEFEAIDEVDDEIDDVIELEELDDEDEDIEEVEQPKRSQKSFGRHRLSSTRGQPARIRSGCLRRRRRCADRTAADHAVGPDRDARPAADADVHAGARRDALHPAPPRPTTSMVAAVVVDQGKRRKGKKGKVQPSRKPKRHLFRTFMTLVLLFGLLAGGAFAAKKYLLHEATWSAELKPLADEVAATRGLRVLRSRHCDACSGRRLRRSSRRLGHRHQWSNAADMASPRPAERRARSRGRRTSGDERFAGLLRPGDQDHLSSATTSQHRHTSTSSRCTGR